MKFRDLIKLVESHGWVHVRSTGSHRIFKHPIEPKLVTIAGTPGKDVPEGTLRQILKDPGLTSK